MTTRRYTETEVRRILDRAVEEGNVNAPSPRDGLSLDEIKEIGAEVGIDEASLERAARALDTQRSSARISLVGGPVSVHSELQVVGDLSATPRNEILSLIRRGMARQGDLSEVGGLLEWRCTGDMGDRAITLSSEHGVTTIVGSADLRNAAVVTFLPASILGAFGAILTFVQAADAANAMGMVLAVLILPVLFFALRLLFGRISRSESAKLERTVSDLGGLLAAADDRDTTGTT